MIYYTKKKRAQNVDDYETWLEGGVVPTLNAMDNSGDSFATVLIPNQTVRRLTPTECERLQGFPDGWTAERFDEKKQAVIPQADSSRYKQMGNAVAVPVVSWIIERMVSQCG